MQWLEISVLSVSSKRAFSLNFHKFCNLFESSYASYLNTKLSLKAKHIYHGGAKLWKLSWASMLNNHVHVYLNNITLPPKYLRPTYLIVLRKWPFQNLLF